MPWLEGTSRLCFVFRTVETTVMILEVFSSGLVLSIELHAAKEVLAKEAAKRTHTCQLWLIQRVCLILGTKRFLKSTYRQMG